MFKFNIFTPPKIIFPSKPTFKTYDNLKFISRLPVKTNNDKIVYLETMPNLGLGNSETIITSKWFNVLGEHTYDMFPSLGVLDGFTMDVYKKHQHNGIGEILRLASIIEMKENGLKEIRLTSLPTALSFHLKYGFKPYCINDNFRMRNILKEISSDSKSAGLLNKIAAKLLEDINNNGFISKTRNCYNEISDLIIKYAFINKERWGTVPLKTHIPLVLTEQTVKANSVHFNNLYKKHELDYRI